MRGDRHITDPKDVHYWMPRCEHCGKPYRSTGTSKYGSNACRQARYRARQAADCVRWTHVVTPRSKTYAEVKVSPAAQRPSKSNKFAGKVVTNGKRFRGKAKGGAA